MELKISESSGGITAEISLRVEPQALQYHGGESLSSGEFSKMPNEVVDALLDHAQPELFRMLRQARLAASSSLVTTLADFLHDESLNINKKGQNNGHNS